MHDRREILVTDDTKRRYAELLEANGIDPHPVLFRIPPPCCGELPESAFETIGNILARARRG